MAQSKYINSFDTTAEYNEYIVSENASFPNIGYDRQANDVHILKERPNREEAFAGTLKFDGSQVNIELVDTNYKSTTLTVNTSGTNFSLDSWGDLSDINIIAIYGDDISTITKFNFDLSKAPQIENYEFIHSACIPATSADLSGITGSFVLDCDSMFMDCTQLETLNINGWHFITDAHTGMFDMCDALRDVYIDNNDTFNLLTNNGTAAYPDTSPDYIPSTATIHFNNTDYRWDGSAWMPQ